MFLLTNEQRACLGLELTEPGWDWVKLRSSAHNTDFETWACFDGDIIRKSVHFGPAHYIERNYREKTAENRTLLLPRTAKGKPKKLSVVTLGERKPLGMRLSWSAQTGSVSLWHADTSRTYYSSGLEHSPIKNFEELSAWLDCWAAETTPQDRAELAAFLSAKRRRVKAKAGDFFRFQVGRRQYGYGRVLLVWDELRRSGRPIWDILMCKPLAVKTYHIITDNPNVPVEALRKLPAMPSVFMADDPIFYGGFPIVGNLPLSLEELDFPIMYGGSISGLDRGKDKVLLQCGTLFRELEGVKPLPGCDRCCLNNGVSFFPFSGTGRVWKACINAKNNDPFWEQKCGSRHDLRNPAFRSELEAVCRQFGLEPEELQFRT